MLADGNIPGGFGQSLELAAGERLTLADDVLGGAVRLVISPPATIRGRPHHTVSQSEAGFEKIMQAVELTFGWTVPDDDCTLQFHLTIAPRTP
jgi:alpha-amylase